MNDEYRVFSEGIDNLRISLSDKQIIQFHQYYEMLIEKNKVMNLTTITKYEDVIRKHFLDSLSLVKQMDMDFVYSLIDVGTGAGFPGIPIKIAFPHIKVVLLDSLNKRLKFLDDVILKLELDDIKSVHSRAEEAGRNPEYREQFDLCVSRAVANLSVLSEYCMPFVRIGGHFISYKAKNVDNEFENAVGVVKKLNGKIEDIKEFTLPGSDMMRVLLKIKKERKISGKYPRKPGLPSREPLD